MSELKGLAAITKGISQRPQETVAIEAPAPKPKIASSSSETKHVKSRDADYVQFKVYVKKKTKTAAARKWEDQGGRDLSDLVESLLTQYLST